MKMIKNGMITLFRNLSKQDLKVKLNMLIIFSQLPGADIGALLHSSLPSLEGTNGIKLIERP